jgi:hypothetical protein
MRDELLPRGGSLRLPRPEPWRRWKRQRLERAQGRPPSGGQRQMRRGPQVCRRVPRRHLRVVEASGGAVAATPAAPVAPAEPSRKRKRRFSSLM